MSAPSVTRGQVLAHRTAVHQLDRSVTSALDLAVLDLGLQDTPVGSAPLSIAARVAGPVDRAGLTSVWAVRGAPHWHRTKELIDVSAALWPLNDEDATRRISVTPIKDGARMGLEAWRETAKAFADTVKGPMAKGDVSTEVTKRIPASLTYWCRACNAQHVAGTVFHATALAGGVRLGRAGSKTVLEPIPDWPGLPVARGLDRLLRTYLRLLGPATEKAAATYLGTTPKAMRPAWPGGLTQVRVDGRPAWLPDDALDLVTRAEGTDLVRLLPASDPWLQARDRELVVPDAARRKLVWAPIGTPGVVLRGGEIVGTWRARKPGARLDVTVTAFDPLPTRVLRAIETEAGRVAEVRGASDVSVVLD